MKIEKIDHNQLKITLSCMEMLQMNLEIDTEKSQNLLTKLFYSLESEFQFPVLNQKIILEMIPSLQEGCHIIITKAESDNVKSKTFEKLLILSVEEWSIAEYIITSVDFPIKTYSMDGLFHLVIYPKNERQRKQFRLLFSDFGEFSPNPVLFESVLSEYGTLFSKSRTQ